MQAALKKALLFILLCATTGALAQFGRGGSGGFGSGGGAFSIGNTVTTPCTTANAVLYNASTPCSANLTFSATNLVGLNVLGSSTAGVRITADASFGYLYSSLVTAAGNNYALAINATETDVGATNTVAIALNGTIKWQQDVTAGKGPAFTAGTAITDVAALSLTRTNNNAAVATGVKWTFTDTSSAAGFLPFQILCGSAATTNCLSVPKEGGIAFTAKAISGTAPTLASGGCTTPTAVTSNGTAAFSVGVGTSCSGSQPLVFTLPAATTGWRCEAQNSSNAATSAPAQSSAVSTTSVTITNYGRTTGLAAAWTDADVVVVSCLGY